MKKICIYLIEWYQKNISKFLDSKNIKCKYYPTCSEYTFFDVCYLLYNS